MRCSRCKGQLHQVPMYDLPSSVEEFACMSCGERFWVKPETGLLRLPTAEKNPVVGRAAEIAARRAQVKTPFSLEWGNTLPSN